MPAATYANVILLGPSRGLVIWIASVCMVACTLTLLYLPVVLSAVACAVMLLQGWIGLRTHALRTTADAIGALRIEPDTLSVQLKGGMWIPTTVLGGGLVTPWLTVLRLREVSTPRKVRGLVLVPGGLTSEDFRRLRVHLTWARNREVKNITE